MATCWNCLLHLLNLVNKASSLLFATFAPWSNAALKLGKHWFTGVRSCDAKWELMSRPATDCIGAAEGLRSAWFRTHDPYFNNAVLVSIDDWVDAGSKELYIYNRVRAHGPPDMYRCFWGHLGPFATILDASVDDRCHTVLHSLFQWGRKKRWG